MQAARTVFNTMARAGAVLLAGTLGAMAHESGPAGLPPPGFEGRQFVDSKGCIYVRASYGGKVVWVPRLAPDRQPMCGFPPTFAKGKTASLSHASPAARPRPGAAAAPSAPALAVRIPEGYRLAWDDGRLNPDRGPRSAAQSERMHRIWTRTVPMRLTDAARAKPARAQAPIAARTLSGKSVAQPQATAPLYVQVGVFGVPENARRAIARLQRLGLPVSSRSLERGGHSYQVVLAGPFSAAAPLNAALARAREAGFADAFPRR